MVGLGHDMIILNAEAFKDARGLTPLDLNIEGLKECGIFLGFILFRVFGVDAHIIYEYFEVVCNSVIQYK